MNSGIERRTLNNKNMAQNEQGPAKELEQGQVEDATPILTLSRSIIVRPLILADAEPMAYQCNNRKIWRNMADTFPYPYSIQNGIDFINSQKDESKWINSGTGTGSGAGLVWEGPPKPACYAVCIDGLAVGGIGMKPGSDVHRRCVEIGYWIGEEFWGQKIMSEVVPAFVNWVWQTFDKFVRIEARNYEWNPASGALLKKTGFEPFGCKKSYIWKDGQIGDTYEWSLVRDCPERS